jgi:SpoVK/Ycf46/Vps4 family AAA+-type ATPase
VLAATNLPWAIDDAARRRFVLRQYIPLPERETRRVQFTSLLSKQHHTLTEEQLEKLVDMTEGLFLHMGLMARIFRIRYYCVNERCGNGTFKVFRGSFIDYEAGGNKSH